MQLLTYQEHEEKDTCQKPQRAAEVES